jgi:3-oxoacyl-[acyl-carrier-protein] synthase-3
VRAFEIRLGCNGMFGALELAANYLQAQSGRRSALLVAADNFGGTKLIDRWRMGPGFIIGDAASAVVLTKDPGFAQLLAVTSVSVPEAEEVHRGSEPLFPPTVAAGRPTDFVSRFHEISAKVTGQPESPLGQALVTVREQFMIMVSRTLAEAGIEAADLTRVAFINCGREAVEQRCMIPLGLPMSMSTWEFGRTIGHCGASDQILSLDHLVSEKELNPGDHLLMMGTAPGVTLSAAVVKIIDRPGWAQ